MHYSVLKNECIENLNIKKDGKYIDATMGYAGHSSLILENLGTGFLYGFDQDILAVEHSTKVLSEISSNFKIFNTNFSNMKEMLEDTKVDGILFDLGFSSPQIDDPSRGFSFMHDGPLDMRMGQSGKSAKDIIDNYKESELAEIFFTYGEEKFSRNIAKKIVENKKDINTTLELVEVIKNAVGANYFFKQHPERKIFQALRIEVNMELSILSDSISQAVDLLNPNGRLCVITFHSLEDRIVKKLFKNLSDIDDRVKGLPVIPEEFKPIVKIINKNVILPTELELSENSRSRSAKLRVVEKL